ncbi:bifunctional hydroxymethylpyrimidine kinase/phosphomethylpyrimidine kinase [Oscillatoria amoena NRMC-F 0135]|nr:bifunctional hydroxymethylpyrimidine kinase/phosphomethylpyrimidine kinase [Oscillatoria amoena NRMC-F 0135]
MKTFSACGVFGATAVTCVVSENPDRVAGIQAIGPALVASQIATVGEFFPVGAAKTGMLYSRGIIEAVVPALLSLRCPVVVDPVMVATSGAALLRPDAMNAVRKKLIPAAALVTPNLDEAALLLGAQIVSPSEAKKAVVALYGIFGVPFLLKGGHLKGKTAVDWLYDGRVVVEYAAPFTRGIRTHGTGCTYSAAICAGLAQGQSLTEAVALGKQFITGAVKNSIRWGKNRSALNHFWLNTESGA